MPGVKVTVTCRLPSEPATDFIYIMPSTALIASSSGTAIESAISLGLAPWYIARTTTLGGTTSGYSTAGRSGMAISPAAKIIIERTMANIGRSMKNLEKSMTVPLFCCFHGHRGGNSRSCFHGDVLRSYGHPVVKDL